jgi:hypothetical protein
VCRSGAARVGLQVVGTRFCCIHRPSECLCVQMCLLVPGCISSTPVVWLLVESMWGCFVDLMYVVVRTFDGVLLLAAGMHAPSLCHCGALAAASNSAFDAKGV